MQVYQEDGLAADLASARVCQDIVLIDEDIEVVADGILEWVKSL